MDCRPGCGACCIAPSISSPIPGMPQGKAAGDHCAQLDDELRCRLFNDPSRPGICRRFAANSETCGANRADALRNLFELEALTMVE
jgi:uncharacterized protein